MQQTLSPRLAFNCQTVAPGLLERGAGDYECAGNTMDAKPLKPKADQLDPQSILAPVVPQPGRVLTC